MINILDSSIVQIIKNIIDILCVAYLIYFVYKLIEDTNSISIVKGFIAILVIYVAANFIDLKTLGWIFKYVVGYFVILVVVLFQPEIRRVLSRIGQSGISGIGRAVSIETINEITEAVFMMSEKKMGGLIILERDVGLKQLQEEAVILDASVKAELLLSIFHKGSILHDGAVLIQGERIAAAQLIIPWIKVDALKKIKSSMGTRHRAGIAVTNDSDAVSIIVSEETGAVSVAHNGKIEHGLTYEIFIRRIHEILGLE